MTYKVKDALSVFYERAEFAPDYLWGDLAVRHELCHLLGGDISGSKYSEGIAAIYENIIYNGNCFQQIPLEETEALDIDSLRERAHSRAKEGILFYKLKQYDQKAMIAHDIVLDQINQGLIKKADYERIYKNTKNEIVIRRFRLEEDQPWEEMEVIYPALTPLFQQRWREDIALQKTEAFLADDTKITDDDIQWHIANAGAIAQLYTENNNGLRLRDALYNDLADLPLKKLGMNLVKDVQGKLQLVCLPELEQRRAEILGRSNKHLVRPERAAVETAQLSQT